MLGSPLIDNPIFCDLLKLKLSLSAIRMGTYMYIYIYTERWECDISPSWQKPACNTFMHISRIFFWHCKWLRLPAINYWISTANNNYSTAPKKPGTGRDSSRGAALVEWSCGTTKFSFSYVNHINHTPRLRFHLRHWHASGKKKKEKGRQRERNANEWITTAITGAVQSQSESEKRLGVVDPIHIPRRNC